MVFDVHGNRKAYLERGEGGRGMDVEEEEDIPIATLSHQDDSCILGSDESHFNVFLIVRDSLKTVSTDHNFWREGRAKAEPRRGPSAYQPNAFPQGKPAHKRRGERKTVLVNADRKKSSVAAYVPEVEIRLSSRFLGRGKTILVNFVPKESNVAAEVPEFKRCEFSAFWGEKERKFKLI